MSTLTMMFEETAGRNSRCGKRIQKKEGKEYLADGHSQGAYEEEFMEWMMQKRYGKSSELGFVISSVPPEVYVSTPITSNEKNMSDPKSKEVESSAKHVKTPRQQMKNQGTSEVKGKNWNKMMERELGEGYSFIKKKCFVCGSLSHLIKDCDYYEKKMARETEFKKHRVFNTGNRVAKPVWTNANRVNHANQSVPKPVQLNAGRAKINSVRPNINTGRTNVNSVRPRVSTVSSNVNTVRSRQPVPTRTSNSFSPKRPQVNQFNQRRHFSKSYSPVRRPIDRNTAKMSYFNAVKGNWGTAVKTSAGYNWRNSSPNSNCDSGPTFIRTVNAKGPQGRPKPVKAWVTRINWRILKNSMGDQFPPLEVAKGYISGKGKIRVGNLDFDSVSFVKELGHFNLFSISQICDKQHKVVFTKTECLVVSSDFKMPNENQILLKVPRYHNMYSFDVKTPTPAKGFACLIAKATSDESKLWHRRFSWVFFLASKDETSGILQNFIRQIENQLSHRVKIIRSDNGTEFKNRDMLEFYGNKGIKQEYSNARTLQQNGVAERMNKTPNLRLLRNYASRLAATKYFLGKKQLVLLDIIFNRDESEELLKHLGKVSENTTTSTPSINTGSEPVNTGSFDPDNSPMTELKIFHKSETGIFYEASYDKEGKEPKKISKALQDDSWVQAMQEELLQFKLQQVWVLVDLPQGMKVIGTKWVTEIKREEEWLSEIRQDWWPKGTHRKKVTQTSHSQCCEEKIFKYLKGKHIWALVPRNSTFLTWKAFYDSDLWNSMDLQMVCRDSGFSKRFQPQEPSPAHQHFSPPQEHAQGQMTLDDLLQVVPQLMTRVDSLENDLKQTKLTMGSAIVKLVKKVKKLEGILKKRNVVSSDSEEEESEAQGRKNQYDPLVSLVQGMVTPSKTTVNTLGEEQVEDISPTTLEAAKTLSRVASQKPKSIDKGRLEKGKETKGKEEEASLAEAIRLDTLEKEEEAKQQRIETNAKLSKSMLGSGLQGEVLKEDGIWGMELSQLKNLSFEEVKEEFDKLVKQVESFAPINFEATKDSLKRFGDELQTRLQ
ncbi:ribonuclease H-like domain-containing protein [Tanacetum coccineum]|uniref:Ribonuclease H-like domain-containing protein n=1 Tax=Tanacetum coccineum TaxID=301880 RepID=A0ABQ4YHQ5_9ASTR